MMTKSKMPIKNNTGHTIEGIEERFHISHMSAVRYLKTLVYMNCFRCLCNSWFNRKKFNGPHFHLQFSAQMQQKWPIFVKNNKSDKKWIVYNNVDQKRCWEKQNESLLTTPKASLHMKKVMLSIWCDYGLGDPSHKSDIEFWQVLLTRQTKDNKW